eukprot:1007891-Pyramimonas_sp.AAC.1
MSCAAATKGRCLTTPLALRAGDRDPGIKLPVECLDLWLHLWREHPDMRKGIQQAWTPVFQRMVHLPPEQRSRHVRGPLSAV